MAAGPTIRTRLSATMRWLPAIGIAVLLIAALARGPQQAVARESRPFSWWSAACGLTLQEGDSAAVMTLDLGVNAYQPLASDGNITMTLVRLAPTLDPYYTVAVQLMAWDSIAHTPDPTTLLLRSTEFGITAYPGVDAAQMPTTPTLVQRNQPGVADPLKGGVVAKVRSGLLSFSPRLPIDVNPDAAASMPTAWLQTGINPLQPMPGPHPALGLIFCGGTSTEQSLRVLQAVTTVDAQDFTTAKIFLERFRVPATCQVHWVEVAVAFASAGGYGSGGRTPVVSIVDLEGIPDPPPTLLPATLARAILPGLIDIGWRASPPLDSLITLDPNHDYGLLLDAGGTFLPGLKRLTGHEGSDFTRGILSFTERDTTADPWRTREGRALSFRLIGVPVAVLGAPNQTSASRLQLRAARNPTRGAVLFTLSGTHGPVPMEVIDARGRRVSSGVASAASWLWTATDTSGRPLPAGVYFVRARGEDGVAISERVVLVR